MSDDTFFIVEPICQKCGQNHITTFDCAKYKEPADEQIKRMVDAFLCWKLPGDFFPDCGITFVERNRGWPTGTNLFTAAQAEEMIRNLLKAANFPPKTPEGK